MRFLAFILVLVAVVAVCAFAQQPPTYDTVANGKTYQAVAACDTVWSTTTKGAGVAATKWRGPITYYYPRSAGVWGSKISMPTRWHMYARKPFRFKAIYQSGDSSGIYHTFADSTQGAWYTAGEHGNNFIEIFPVVYTLNAQISQLRIVPATSDTVYVVPQVAR
jgi:hypothetical protein